MDQRRILAAAVTATLLFCAATFHVGWRAATNERAARLAVDADLRHNDPTVRIAALRAARDGETHPDPALLIRRMTDSHHFVGAHAAETVYRLGLSPHLTAETAAAVISHLPVTAELTRRWLLAVIIAYDFAAGFELTAAHLPGMTSPWSRPFMLQILERHADATKDGDSLLTTMRNHGGARTALADELERWRAAPADRKFTGFFPPELQIEKIPSPPGGS